MLDVITIVGSNQVTMFTLSYSTYAQLAVTPLVSDIIDITLLPTFNNFNQSHNSLRPTHAYWTPPYSLNGDSPKNSSLTYPNMRPTFPPPWLGSLFTFSLHQQCPSGKVTLSMAVGLRVLLLGQKSTSTPYCFPNPCDATPAQ